jgi:tetratricopeptide (TPR) repeat protein
MPASSSLRRKVFTSPKCDRASNRCLALCEEKLLTNFSQFLYNCDMRDIPKEKGETKETSTAWFQTGLKRQNRRRYREAITAYTRAIDIDPGFSGFYAMRGFTYGKLGFNRKALSDYNKAIKLDPEAADTYYMRGALFARMGDFRRALKDLNRSLQLDPQPAEVYVMRGSVYMVTGNTFKAINDYKVAARLGHKTSQNWLGRKKINWQE